MLNKKLKYIITTVFEYNKHTFPMAVCQHFLTWTAAAFEIAAFCRSTLDPWNRKSKSKLMRRDRLLIENINIIYDSKNSCSFSPLDNNRAKMPLWSTKFNLAHSHGTTQITPLITVSAMKQFTHLKNGDCYVYFLRGKTILLKSSQRVTYLKIPEYKVSKSIAFCWTALERQ